MPRGDSLKKFWEEYRAGNAELGPNHGKRGKDKPGTVRAIGDNRTLQKRYYERTGRRMDQEMADEKALINMMLESASAIADPQERLDALARVQTAQNRFNTTWASTWSTPWGPLEPNKR